MSTVRDVELDWRRALDWTPGAFRPDTVYRIPALPELGGRRMRLAGDVLAVCAENPNLRYRPDSCRPRESTAMIAGGLRPLITANAVTGHGGASDGESPVTVVNSVAYGLLGHLIGETSVVWLSAGQAEALSLTDFTDTDLIDAGVDADGTFGDRAFIVLERPLPLSWRDEFVDPNGEPYRIVLHAGYRYTIDGEPQWLELISFTDTDVMFWTLPTTADTAATVTEAPGRGMLEAIWRGIRFFGTTWDAAGVDMEPVDRAEARRQEREAAKRPRSTKAGERVIYLNDRAQARPRRQDSTGSDRRNRPHWRRGHVRWVRYGPANITDRPVRAAYVAPTLVNADLVAAGHPLARRIYTYKRASAPEPTGACA